MRAAACDLPAFGKPDQADVGEQLQREAQRARRARLGRARRSRASGASAWRSARCRGRRARRARRRSASPSCARSASSGSPSRRRRRRRCVPTGTRDRSSVGAARGRCARSRRPRSPDSARYSRRMRWSSSVARLRSASSTTSPPRPPSPPSGPPRGTYFSRRKLHAAVAAVSGERTVIDRFVDERLVSMFIAVVRRRPEAAALRFRRRGLGLDAGDDAGRGIDRSGRRRRAARRACSRGPTPTPRPGMDARARPGAPGSARLHRCPPNTLMPAALRVAVAPVARAALTLLVRHARPSRQPSMRSTRISVYMLPVVHACGGSSCAASS